MFVAFLIFFLSLFHQAKKVELLFFITGSPSGCSHTKCSNRLFEEHCLFKLLLSEYLLSRLNN